MHRTARRLFNTSWRLQSTHICINVLNSVEIECISIRCRRIHSLLNATLYARNAELVKNLKFPSKKDDKKKHMSEWWRDYLRHLSFEDRCTNRISRSLEVGENYAKSLIRSDPLAFLDKIDVTLENVEYLLEQGMTTKAIRGNISVLSRSMDDLKMRIDCMKEWGIDKQMYSDFLVLFKLKNPAFTLVSKLFVKDKEEGVPYGNRMIYLAKMLDYSLEEICQRLFRCTSLLGCNFELIQSALECYKKFGVKNELIFREIAGLQFEKKVIEGRLSGPFERGLKPLSPGLVLCTDPEYDRRIEKLKKQMNYFSPYKSCDEYLTAKLFSHVKIATSRKRLYDKCCRFIDAERLTSVLEFLLERKYTPRQILTYTHILSYDLSSLKERCRRLQEVGVQNPTLKLLVLNDEEFEYFFQQTAFAYREDQDIISEMSTLISRSEK